MAEVGWLVADYSLIKRLGSCSAGEVWEANRLGHRYAIKVTHDWLDEPARQRLRAAMEDERRRALPGHVRIVDVVTAPQGQLAIVMELLTGDTLMDVMRRGPHTPRDAANLVAKLIAIISGGGAHLFLNPWKVFRIDGDPVITGYSSRTWSRDDEPPIRGNPRYDAPELFTGQATDWRADLYTVGMFGFEMISGRAPCRTDDIMSMISSKLEPPPRLRSFVPDAPEILDEALDAILQPDPERRLSSDPELRVLWDDVCRALR